MCQKNILKMNLSRVKIENITSFVQANEFTEKQDQTRDHIKSTLRTSPLRDKQLC